jgi:hypothetical protein
MRRMIAVGLACLVTPAVIGVATSGAKTTPTKPLAWTVGLGGWVETGPPSCVTHFLYSGQAPPSPCVNFDVNEIAIGDETIIAYVRYIDLINVTQPCLGTTSGYSRSTGGPDGQPILSTAYTFTNSTQATGRIHIGPKGQFSWHGKVYDPKELNDGQSVGEVPMNVSGRFLSNTKARMTWWIHTPGCSQRTVTLKVKPGQVPPGKTEQPPGK